MKEFYLKSCLRQYFMETGEVGFQNDTQVAYAKMYAKERNMKYNEYIYFLLHGYDIENIKPSEVYTLKCWKLCGKYEYKSKNILQRAGLTSEEAIGDNGIISCFDGFNKFYKEVKALVSYIYGADVPAATVSERNINLAELIVSSRMSGKESLMDSVNTDEFRKFIKTNVLNLSVEKDEKVAIRMGTLYTPNKLKKESLVDLCIDYIGLESVYVKPDILAILKEISRDSSIQSALMSNDDLAEDLWQILLDLGIAMKMHAEHYDSNLAVKTLKDLVPLIGFDFYVKADTVDELIYCNSVKNKFTVVTTEASNIDCVIKVDSKDIGIIIGKNITFKTAEVLSRNTYTMTPNVAFLEDKELSKVLTVIRRPNRMVNDYSA